MKIHMKTKLHLVIPILALFAGVYQVGAQGTTAFTYQGQLRDGGTNANGPYTMIFKLYDSADGGNQKGPAITDRTTLANGLFTVNLDFGAGPFLGAARWLDITVTNGGDTETLAPRVQILPTPYALFATVAGTVTNGAIMNEQLGSNAVATANLLDEAITPEKLTNDSAGLSPVTGGAAFMTNTVSDDVAVPTLAVNGYIQSTTGGFIFPDGTVQTTATPSHGITNFDAATNFDEPVSNIFTVPAGVTQLYIEAWGGGGGSGGYDYDPSVSDYAFGGGGGGAGGYARGVINVTPLQSYLVKVGNAGTSGDDNQGEDGTDGTDGGDTLIATTADSEDPGVVFFECTGGGGGEGGTVVYDAAVAGGAGGQSEPSAGIQRSGFPGSPGGAIGYAPGGLGPLGTLQPALGSTPIFDSYSGTFSGFGQAISYGSGGEDETSGAVGGCIIIQW
jgi:hypothetical protein